MAAGGFRKQTREHTIIVSRLANGTYRQHAYFGSRDELERSQILSPLRILAMTVEARSKDEALAMCLLGGPGVERFYYKKEW